MIPQVSPDARPIAQPSIILKDIEFRDDAGDVHYITTEDVPTIEGGTDTGRLLVRLNIDGGTDTTVHVDDERSGGLALIRESIAALQRLERHLTALYGDDIPRGQCMRSGDWGRCRLRQDHDGDHATPTQEQWEAAFNRRQRRVS